jgi:hypothetical protein
VADGTSAHDAATLEQVPLIEAGDNITITADGTDATTGQTKYKISGVVEKEIAGQVLLTGSGINTATGTNATVTGGQGNQATGNYASVSGGSYNTAEGESSVVAGGYYGKATGKYAGIYGGGQSSGSAGANTASGDYSVVSGGWGNTASGTDASVFGGVTNTAAGKNSVIVGGNGNNVTSAANQSSDSAVIVGGSGNTVSGIASTIVGGYRGTASGKNSTIVGGSFNKASGTNATTVGGSLNTATGTYASVFGGGNAGNGNTASGDYSVVSGGWGNTASGTQASIYGGVGNKAAGSLSSIYGGSYNTINAVSESDTGTITGGFKNAISGGHDASILGGSYNTAKGNYSTITGGSYNQVVGEYALAAGGSRNIAGGSKSVALGGGSEGYNGNIANGSRSTVIGGSSNYTIGANSTALGGYHSIVQGQYSTGIGGGSTGPNASYGVAVGPSSVVTVSNGTAVGFQSTASKEGTVSFGHNVGDVSGYSINWNKNADGSYDYTTAPTITEQTYSSAVYNRLVNVGYGKDGHDAATMDQLTKVAAGDRVTVTSSKDATTGATTYTVSANNDGSVALGDTNLVSGGTVYSEVRPGTDGTYVKTANTTGANLTALDTQVKTNADDITVLKEGIYVSVNGAEEKANLKAGDTLNLAAGDNAVLTADTANRKVTIGVSKTPVFDSVETKSLKLGDTAKTDVTYDGDRIQYTAGTVTKSLATTDDGLNFKVGDQTLSQKLNSTLEVAAGDNVTVTGTDGKITISAVDTKYTAGDHIAISSDNQISARVDGSVASGNADIVSGGTVYSEVRPESDGNYIRTGSTTGANLTALDTQVKANADQISTNTTNITNLTNLSNITNEGETVIRNLAKGSVKVVDGTNTTVTTGTDGDATTYAVNVSNDSIKEAVADDLAKKANVDASNIGTYLTDEATKEANLSAWGTALGTGSVASGNGQLVTGGTVYSEVRPAADGNYIRTASTTGANLTALDTQVKANADQIGTNTTNITNLTNLSNITNEGETVIKNLAKGAVKVAAGTNISVTDSTGTDGAVTYTVAAQSDGQVAQNDTKLVTGDTVYNYVKNLTDQNTTDLANKANVDASNVTGDNIGKWQSVLGTGSVANGNTGLVTGGTIFTYVTPVAASGQTFRYISTNRTTGENLAALDQQVGTNADSITTINTTINNLGDTYAKTDLSNITDNGRTVIKNLAKGSISMENGSHTTVSKRDVNGVDTYKVDVDTSGTVTSGNTGIGTGGTVYDAIQAIKDETNVSNKANVDASNIGKNLKKADGTAASESEQKANAESWGDAIGTGKVENGDKRLVTGDTVSRAIQDETRVSENGNYITTDTSAADNLKKLDSQVKTNADNITNNTTAINNIKNITDNLDANYAKTDLTNITTAGETKIKNLAQDAVKVVNGNNTTVRTISGTDGNISYAVDVSDADIKNVMKEDMDKKADRNAGNLTDSDVTAWQNKLGTGESRSGDHRLINGDTLYNALSQIDGDSLVETNGVTINIDKDGTAKTIDIHGKDGSLRTITSVATNPSDPTSAANVDYVDHRVQSLNNRLTQDISRVGAGAAALAALHPLEYDPNNEFEFAVGYGHYKVANAAAMGVFYRPSRAAMYSFGGTLGNGDAMFNAGVTFRFGGPRHVEATPMSTSNVLSAQTERIQQQDALIQTQNQQIHQQNMKIDQLEKELIELKRMIMKKA